MKLDFNKPLVGLDDKPVFENGAEQNIGKLLASLLVSGATGDIFKFYDWAKEIYAGRTIDLDKSDQETLKKFISDAAQITILSKAQLLECFEHKNNHRAEENHIGNISTRNIKVPK